MPIDSTWGSAAPDGFFNTWPGLAVAGVASGGPAAAGVAVFLDYLRRLCGNSEARFGSRQLHLSWLMLALAADLYALESDALVKSAQLSTFARLQLSQLRKRARKRYSAAGDLQAEKLHELRVALKRLRYGIEFLLPLLPQKATVRYANALADAQETLGYLNDEAVARTRLKAWAGKDPELRSGAAFVAGWHAPRIARLRRNILPALEPILWGKAPWRR